MNSVQLVGRLTREVDLRFTSSGTAVGTFTLAVNRSFTNQQGEREADFIRCVIWRKAAENFANFTRKGSLVGVEGRIQVRNYENQQGERVYITEVVVDNFHLLESRQVTEQRPRETDSNTGGSFNNNYQNNNYKANSYSNKNYDQQNSNSGNGSGFNQNYNSVEDSPFSQDGKHIDISEDDLPF